MRLLFRLAALIIILYAGAIIVLDSLTSTAGSSEVTTMSIPEMSTTSLDELTGRSIQTTGRVESAWTIGALHAIRLADPQDQDSAIVVLGTGASVPRTGQLVRLQFSAYRPIRIGSFDGPLLFLAESAWVPVR